MAIAYVLLLAVVALGVPLGISLRDRADAEVKGQARSQVDVVAASASEALEHHRLQGLRVLARRSARSVRGRVIVVDTDGLVLADSAGDAQLGYSYASRPEVKSALRGTGFQHTRHSDTLGEDILATAVPVLSAGLPIGAVRATQSVAAVHSAVNRSFYGIAVLGLLVLGLGILAGALIAQRIASPIRRMADAADDVAAGDLDAKVSVEGSSEQRSLARSFNSMTERVGRMIQSQKEFVADASHQLRTPLTGVRLRLEELASNDLDDEDAATVEAAIHEVDRLAAIVDELLTLSRSGESELTAEEVDLAAVADRAADRWARAAAASDLHIVRRSAGRPSVARCVPGELARVLDAVIENSVIYGPGPGDIEIIDGDSQIEVLDHGPGFGPGEESSVTERFFRGKAGLMGPQGTGLGLSIAQELASQWGGGITASNRPGGGARIVLGFPTNGNSGS